MFTYKHLRTNFQQKEFKEILKSNLFGCSRSYLRRVECLVVALGSWLEPENSFQIMLFFLLEALNACFPSGSLEL